MTRLDQPPGSTRPATDQKGSAMDNEKRAFDSAGFFDLLGEVMTLHNTGVVSLRIHIRDGLPWAVSVDFDSATEKAA